MTTITVPSKFNGPPARGNGGYSCGVVAEAFDGPAAVSLRRAVPLDEPLDLRTSENGSLCGFAGNELVAEAIAAPPLAPWSGPAVSLTEARVAHERFDAPSDGTFDHCFVCGRARPDGFGIFSGPLGDGGRAATSALGDDRRAEPDASGDRPHDERHNGGDVVASPWTPPTWATDSDGAVRPEFVWAALDCPGYFALHGTDLTVAYLARQQVEILTPLRAGVEYVAVGRALERSGRKGLAATAILDPGGEVLAHGECLLVVPRAAV
jgi:hypothetical protein